MNNDTTTPEEELLKLEEDAADGKPVTASQLAEARAKIDLIGFVKKGQAKRAAEKAARDAVEQREAAKTASIGKLKGQPDEMLAAYDAAVAAMDALYSAHEAYTAQIQRIGEGFRQADVVSRTAGLPTSPENFDFRFHASWEPGGIVGSVTVDGKAHGADRVERWLRTAAHTALSAHRETQSFASKLGNETRPQALTEREQ